MKPNEPSRTALIPARHRAAHQVLDHGSILDDPFAMQDSGRRRKGRAAICERTSPWPASDVWSAPHEAGLRKMLCQDAVERGIRQIIILGAGLDTFALRNPHAARQIRVYRGGPPRDAGMETPAPG